MRERSIGIQELHANLGSCLDEVRRGTTLLLTDGEHRVARLIPEPDAVRLAGRTSHRLERTPPEEDQAEGPPARRGQHGRHRQGEPSVTLLYLDTSALFKRYVEEAESKALIGRIEDAPAVGTALITRVEVAAALAKAVRDDRMPSSEAREAESDFLDDWADFTRIGLTDDVAGRAGRLAWKHDLRGYDAAQLAAALAWREATEDAEDQVVFACFDNDLRRAAAAEGLETWPA